MDYELPDSSGTDDDFPPSHQNRFQTNGSSRGAGSAPFHRMHNDMEMQIHHIEQEAYCSVLRAFKAQSDAITWDKESLITELRKELRVSDEEHRELLMRVDGDDTIRRISEWRKAIGLQPGMHSSTQPVHSPNVSASRKKQKTSNSVPSLSGGAAPSLQPSLSFRRSTAPGVRGKKPKSSTQYPSTGRASRVPAVNLDSSAGFRANELTEAATSDSLIGRKVWTRWPEDNSFYEAVITDYKKGHHALVYDINSANETWEWVNLKEISPEDIRWEVGDPEIAYKGSSRPGRGMLRSMGRCGPHPGMGRGRGITRGMPGKGLMTSKNRIGKNFSGDIEILNTETLIREVEKVFSSNQLDPLEIEKAKKVLKDHEQALVDAIARLEDASDGESEGEPFSQSQMDQEQGWREQQYDEMGGDKSTT